MPEDQPKPDVQQEPDDMQRTFLDDGTPVGDRQYTRGQVIAGGLVGAGITAAAAIFGPSLVYRFFHAGEQQPKAHENPFPLNPSEIQIGEMTTRLTTNPDITLGLPLRTAPDTNAPLLDYTTVDAIGAYNPELKHFVGFQWPHESTKPSQAGEPFHEPAAINIVINNVAIQRTHQQQRWGVLQVLTNSDKGGKTVRNVYFDMSGPTLSADFVTQKVLSTDLHRLTYQVQQADGTKADIPMALVDQVSAVTNTTS